MTVTKQRREAPPGPWTREAEVVRLCARTRMDADVALRLEAVLDEPLDWDRLLSFAARHHVSALLFHHLSRVAPSAVDPAILENLRNWYFRMAARNLRLVGQAIPLLAELEDRGTPAVVWKGPVLAHTVYPSPELRTFTDVDLLIRRKDAPAVGELLMARGFRPRLSPEQSLATVFRRPTQPVTMIHSELDVVMDLHWGSVRRHYSPVMDCERLWPQHARLRMGGAEVRALRVEPMLLALCVHGAKHGPYPWPTLKWVTDVESILAGHPADRWPAILDRATELGCRRMLLMGLHLTRALLDVPLPRPVEGALVTEPAVVEASRPILERILSSVPAPFTFADRLRFDFGVRERRRDRVRYAAVRLLTPSRRDAEATPGSASPLHLPVRLGRLAYRYLLHPSRARAFLLGSGRDGGPEGGSGPAASGAE